MTTRSSSADAAILAISLLAGACTDDGPGPGDLDGAEAATDGEAEDPGDGDGDDAPAQIECAPDQLDVCPPDTKCTSVVAADGLSYAFECVMDSGALQPGELCMPAPPTGVDGCPTGYACIPDTNQIPSEGHCEALCLDDDACLGGLCAATPTSPVRICLERCDPLLVTCPETHACRYLEDRAFACVLPQPDDIGVQGAECDGVNQRGCANGFVCMSSFEVPECFDSDFCCTAICPIDGGGGAECPAESTCEALALEFPELDNVGACTL